ncbi:amino acid transporter [Bacteroidetes bacterium UKL13-3]|jgi:APA family basic amino acid/polyamine antiporter|nr:amino acid transporter [Bacteroidetes bacterium UKL13-3]HCP93308.1 amino acid transporter [Bacteroidota bacterium]
MQTSKKLSLLDCTMLIIGSMIGSGIFIVPAAMSRDLGSPFMLLLAWFVTALLTLFAALSYGELAAMMPKAGGQYVYLREAYNPLFGFLYGWTLFTVIQTGTIAAVAVAFAKFSGVFFSFISPENVVFQIGSFTVQTQQILAIAIVWLLTFSNFRNVKSGAFLQNIFTFTKIGAIVFMIGAGLYFALTHDTIAQDYSIPSQTSSYSYWGIFCVALVGSIFSSDAWNNVTFTGSEIEKPERNLPLSLVMGTTIVLGIYMFINWVYLQVLSFDAIQHAENDRVGTVMLQTVFGDVGMYLMAALIMISTFGCINGLTLSGSRVYYAMAKDKLFFAKAGTLNQNDSPQFALIIQAIWTSILTLSGSYGDLLDYVVFAVLIFYVLTVAGIFVLRHKQPNAPRPYKVFAYPYLPAIYILLASFICINLLLYKPDYTYPGLGIVLLGIPVYYLIKKKF